MVVDETALRVSDMTLAGDECLFLTHSNEVNLAEQIIGQQQIHLKQHVIEVSIVYSITR